MSASNHPNSKTVTIFRAGSFLSRAQGETVQDHFASSSVSVGSYFESANSSMVGSGLDFKEQELLMPILVDAPKEDREFRKLVRAYFEAINTKIPHNTGCVLEIGLLESNDKPLSKDNMPIDISDFVRYRHARAHPYMAQSMQEANSNPLKQYYIFDKVEAQKKINTRDKVKDAAMQIYLAAKKEIAKVNMMLTLLNVDIREYEVGEAGDAQKVVKLRELAETDPTKFVKIHDEEDMDIRYWIEAMRTTGVMKLIGQKYVDGETNKVIGNTLEETMFYFKDETNSDQVTLLKARLQEAQRTPVQVGPRRTKALPVVNTSIPQS